MEHSTLWLWLPDVLLVVSIAILKWVILASACRWVHAGLLRALCKLIDCLYWLLMCYRLYLSDVTSAVLYAITGFAAFYYLVQPELIVRPLADAAPAGLDICPSVAEPLKQPRGRSARRLKSQPQSPPAGRTSSRKRSRIRRSSSITLSGTLPTPTNPQRRPSSSSSPQPSQSSVKLGSWSWKGARSTLYTLLLILYLRTSYTPEALTALEQCLSYPSYGTWQDCVAPIFRHECPVYYSSEALDTARECLELRDRQWEATSINGCLRPLYAHRSPPEGQDQNNNNLRHAEGEDPCWIKLHGLSGTFPWPPSTNEYDILNITKNIPREGIRKAYQDAVRRWHPDKGGRVMEKESLDCIIRHVNDAYEKLDTKRRGGWFS